MNKKYPLQLWLTSICLAPILMGAIGLLTSRFFENVGLRDWPVFLLFLIVGLIFSFPTFLITLFFFKMIVRKVTKQTLIKMAINLISILGVFISFLIIQGPDSFNWNGNLSGLAFSIIYSGSVVISSLFYKVFNKTRTLPLS